MTILPLTSSRRQTEQGEGGERRGWRGVKLGSYMSEDDRQKFSSRRGGRRDGRRQFDQRRYSNVYYSTLVILHSVFGGDDHYLSFEHVGR